MKFTIITVVKNDEINISNTIKSVLSQTFTEFEYIIVDGRSTDKTIKNIESINDTRIKLYSIEDNSVYEALNYGIKKSIGEYIVMMHSGDIFFDNNVLRNISQSINLSQIIVSNCFYFSRDKSKILRKWVKPFKKISKYNSYKIAHTTMVIKKSIFFDIGFYSEKFQISSDTDFILNLISMNKEINYKNINSVLMMYGGKSTSLKYLKQKIKEDLKIYYKYFGIFFIFFYFLKISSKLFDFIYSNKSNL